MGAQEADEVGEEVARLRTALARVKAMQGEAHEAEAAYRAALGALSKRLAGGGAAWGAERAALRAMEKEHPSRVPFLLWAALGSVSLRMASDKERLRYKASYERFKLLATMAHLGWALLLLVVRGSVLLDAAGHFALLYAYSALTMREHILILNGSRMHPWWVWHHYLCVALAGALLLWPQLATTDGLRRQLLVFMVYIAAVQILLYRYQMGRLYTLRALSRVNPMQTTSDAAGCVHASSNHVALLLPIVFAGHLFQFYNCYTLLAHARAAASGRWQAHVIALLFALLGAGNAATTLYTVAFRRPRGGRPFSSASASMPASVVASPFASALASTVASARAPPLDTAGQRAH